MMFLKLKPKKCAYNKCRAVFEPKTEWQKYCKPLHRYAEANRQRAQMVKMAQRIMIKAQQGAA